MTSKEGEMACLPCRPQSFVPFRSWMTSEEQWIESIQLKQNVSFCHNSVRHKSDRGLLMDGFLWGMQC
jgi:hypothetical protein